MENNIFFVYNENFSDTRRKFLAIQNVFVAYGKKIYIYLYFKFLKNSRPMMKISGKGRKFLEILKHMLETCRHRLEILRNLEICCVMIEKNIFFV